MAEPSGTRRFLGMFSRESLRTALGFLLGTVGKYIVAALVGLAPSVASLVEGQRLSTVLFLALAGPTIALVALNHGAGALERYRHRHPRRRSHPEVVAWMDSHACPLHLCEPLHASFGNLQDPNPYFEFSGRLFNGSIYPASISRSASGRIQVSDQEIHDPPEIIQVDIHEGNTGRTQAASDPIVIPHAKEIGFRARQRLFPEVARMIRELGQNGAVRLNFSRVDFEVRFLVDPDAPQDDPERWSAVHRLPLTTGDFNVPQ